MKKSETIGVRVPRELRGALERERKRMSREIGAEVKTSAVVRAILEEKLERRPSKVRAA